MNAPASPSQPRLTSLSHGGGCGCKIAPGVLSDILKGTAAMPMPNGYIGQKITAAPSMSGTRVPAALTEQGLKDTVVCPPGWVTRILISFKRPGTYVYHCHILSHEEHDMMRWFKVI